MKTDSDEELNVGDRILFKGEKGDTYEGVIKSIDEISNKVEIDDSSVKLHRKIFIETEATLCNGCLSCLYGHIDLLLAETHCAAPERIFRKCKNPSVGVWRYKQYMDGEIP